MNRQPYCTPPTSWPPKMTPWWVRLSRGYRSRQLRRGQRLREIVTQNPHVVTEALAAGKGVLLTPNHAAHYDAPALYVAFDAIQQPLYIMTAWQVFAMSTPFERWAMQRLGCFSIDREGTDRQAFKQAVGILQHERHPLVVFPEGDIYHTTDCVTSFREGAAAIALAATKRGERPVVIIPCGIKFWYLDDPRVEMQAALQRIEERLYLRVDTASPLPQRLHRLAEASLALKELDYLGYTCSGRLRHRVRGLLETVLSRLERRYAIAHPAPTPPERVKVLRQMIIHRLEAAVEYTPNLSENASPFQRDMDDLFLAMQLYSYRGDYLADHPSLERLAETIDKLEEDVLGLDYPTVRGDRRVTIRFGEPLELPPGKSPQTASALTSVLQARVQAEIDALNTLSSK